MEREKRPMMIMVWVVLKIKQNYITLRLSLTIHESITPYLGASAPIGFIPINN
jgi:hypothetical protein